MNEIDYWFKVWLLTIPTPSNFVLGQITIGKTKIANDQELQKITSIGNNLPYYSLN